MDVYLLFLVDLCARRLALEGVLLTNHKKKLVLQSCFGRWEPTAASAPGLIGAADTPVAEMPGGNNRSHSHRALVFDRRMPPTDEGRAAVANSCVLRHDEWRPVASTGTLAQTGMMPTKTADANRDVAAGGNGIEDSGTVGMGGATSRWVAVTVAGDGSPRARRRILSTSDLVLKHDNPIL